MTETSALPNENNRPFWLEQHGFDFIPESERTMTMKEANFFMTGTQANLVTVVLGGVGYSLGLNLWQATLAAVLGNMLFAYVAFACIAGPRAGVPTLTFTRSAFGVRGNKPNVALTWISLVAFESINTIFGAFALLAFLPTLGVAHPGWLAKVLCTVGVLVLSGIVAVLGHATMVYLQRFFAVFVPICLILTFAFSVGSARSVGTAHLSTGAAIGAFLVATSVNASNPLSYLLNSPEWFRYLPSSTSGRRIFWNIFASAGITATFLGALGAILASQIDISNPVAGAKPLLPTWFFVPFVVAVVGSTIANNVPTYYSSGLTLQALGLPLRRWQATLVDTTLSTALTLWVLFHQNFLTVLNDFVALLVVWVGPWGGVWLADAVLRRFVWSAVDLHAVTERGGRYWGRAGWNPAGWIALLVGVGFSLLAVNAPILQGPLSSALDGADISWLLGFWFSAGVYVALSARRLRSQPPPSAEDQHPSSLGEAAALSAEHHHDLTRATN